MVNEGRLNWPRSETKPTSPAQLDNLNYYNYLNYYDA